MSDKKISELTEETTLADTDEFVFARSGVNYKVKKSNLASSHKIKDEGGTALTQRTNLNFVGTNVTATDNAGTDSTDITVGGAIINGHGIKDEGGATLTQRSYLNFTGSGVTATDNAGTDSTDVTITSGGGATGTRASFAHADLTAGVLRVTHNLGLSAPFSLLVTITDDSNNIVIPSSIVFTHDYFDVDLLFADEFCDITGNWGVYYI